MDYEQKINELQGRIVKLINIINDLSNTVSNLDQKLNGASVQIKNWEGYLKIVSSAPTEAMTDGTLLLYENGTTRKFYARINNAWYSATLT